MEPIRTLWEAPSDASDSDRTRARRGGPLPDALRELHPGPLEVRLRPDRPTIMANFVSTVDGVVALDRRGATGGGEISGFAEPDRFLMGLLRAMADAVLVGAATVRAAPDHVWTASRAYRPATSAFGEWRGKLGIPSLNPTTVIVSARGDIDPAHPGLTAPNVPVVLATTAEGAEHFRAAAASHGPRRAESPVRVEVLSHSERVPVSALVDLLRQLGARLVLCEGGPRLMALLLAEGLVDELFLTVSPQLVGRDDANPRLSLVEGAVIPAGPGRWGKLESVHRSGHYLFLRYGLPAST